jgi:hypothetical protein
MDHKKREWRKLHMRKHTLRSIVTTRKTKGVRDMEMRNAQAYTISHGKLKRQIGSPRRKLKDIIKMVL